MIQVPKDTRTPAEKFRDTAGIIGSLKHEGYVPNPEDEAIHQRAERGEITTEEAIAIFRERAFDRLTLATNSAVLAQRKHQVKAVHQPNLKPSAKGLGCLTSGRLYFSKKPRRA